MWLAIIFVGGLARQHAAVMLIAGLAMVVLVIQLGLIQNYQVDRIEKALNINVQAGEKFQSEQALIALGSGGWLGQGFGQGQQSQLRYLPVRHTDFIFSVIGEELGLVGSLVFMALLMFIILRSLRAAWIARDTFGRLLCVSVAAVLFLQTYINLGMQMGLMPVTGVVLPFVSYGRSNLLAAMAAIGVVESVVMRYKKLEF
jgi:rod shape determining protein RodA